MYVNLLPLQDQANDLIEAIRGIQSPEERLSATLSLEDSISRSLFDLKREASYALVSASQAVDAGIETDTNPRKIRQWATSWAMQKNLPRRRLRLHHFDPQEAVDLRASSNRLAPVTPIHPNVSPEPPEDRPSA